MFQGLKGLDIFFIMLMLENFAGIAILIYIVVKCQSIESAHLLNALKNITIIKFKDVYKFLRLSIKTSTHNVNTTLRDSLDIGIASDLQIEYAKSLLISNSTKIIPSLIGNILVVFFGKSHHAVWKKIAKEPLYFAIIIGFLCGASGFFIALLISLFSENFDILYSGIRSIAVGISGSIAIISMNIVRTKNIGLKINNILVYTILPGIASIPIVYIFDLNPSLLFLFIAILNIFMLRKYLCI